MRIVTLLMASLTLLVSVAATAEVDVQPGEYLVFYHHDVLGSPVTATNELGQVIWHERTESYGKSEGRVSQNGNAFGDNALPAANSRQGYTGHTLDNSAGLTYMKARYYDHNIGRFLSNDPVGFTSDQPMMFNRYAYANNNSYTYVDPDGMKVDLAIPDDSPTRQDYDDLRASEEFGGYIKELEDAEETYTITEPDLKPTLFERLFGSNRAHHAQYDPETRTIYITPGVKTKVGGKAPGEKLFWSKVISHKGTLLHELGHAHTQHTTGRGDGSNGLPRQKERNIHRKFDNPFNGFERGQGGKFIFP